MKNDEKKTMTADEWLEAFYALSSDDQARVSERIFATDESGEEGVFVPTPEQRADIQRGLADVEAGRTTPLEEFRRTVLKRD